MCGVPKQMNQIQLQEIAKWIHDAPLKSATSSALVTWLLLGCVTTMCAETWSCIPSSCFIAEVQPPNTYLELAGFGWQSKLTGKRRHTSMHGCLFATVCACVWPWVLWYEVNLHITGSPDSFWQVLEACLQESQNCHSFSLPVPC